MPPCCQQANGVGLGVIVLVGVGVRVGSVVAVFVGLGVADIVGVAVGSALGWIVCEVAGSGWEDTCGRHALAPMVNNRPKRISIILFNN